MSKPMSKANAASAPLINFLQTMVPVREEIIQLVNQHATAITVIKGSYLLCPGECCSDYYFIHKGVLRAFIKYGKKEITTWINVENEITTSIPSMAKRGPSREYIQALETCQLICVPFDTVEKLYDRFPEVNVFARRLLEEYYAIADEQTFVSRIPNAELRYQHFIESRPELINRIPLKYIASYLGMTVETIVRLRGKKARKTHNKVQNQDQAI